MIKTLVVFVDLGSCSTLSTVTSLNDIKANLDTYYTYLPCIYLFFDINGNQLCYAIIMLIISRSFLNKALLYVTHLVIL